MVDAGESLTVAAGFRPVGGVPERADWTLRVASAIGLPAELKRQAGDDEGGEENR